MSAPKMKADTPVDSKGAAIDEKLDEILIPDDDCFKVPGQHCGSCLADFEDSSHSDMRCCEHTKWRDAAKQAILAILAQELTALNKRLNQACEEQVRKAVEAGICPTCGGNCYAGYSPAAPKMEADKRLGSVSPSTSSISYAYVKAKGAGCACGTGASHCAVHGVSISAPAPVEADKELSDIVHGVAIGGIRPEATSAIKPKEALTAIYEIGLEKIGKDESMEVEGGKQYDLAELMEIMRPIEIRNELKASQRKAWAKACGVAE